MSWKASGTTGTWRGITSSSDGLRLVACSWEGDIYVSSDGGATWADRSPAIARTRTSVAMSADGRFLAGSARAGGIYTSRDGGASLTNDPGAGGRY